MTENEWIKSIRKRTHDLANRMHTFTVDVITVRQQVTGLSRRVDDLEHLTKLVHRLEHESRILRWLLSVATAVATAALLRAL